MEFFAPGDWVTWRFAPFDTDGPYHNPETHWISHNPGHLNEFDTINAELMRFKAPPYEAVIIIDTPEGNLDSVGHPQIIGVRMFPNKRKLKQDPVHPNPDVRHFSGKLFRKVTEELVPWVSLECRRLGTNLHEEYRPPPEGLH